MPLANSLAISSPALLGSIHAPAPIVYERTAFLDFYSGNDGMASLNNPIQAYSSIGAAVYALISTYPGESTTIILKSDYGSEFGDDPNWDAILAAGLTVRSDVLGSNRSFMSNVPFGTVPVNLTLSSINITLLVKSQASPNMDAGSLQLNNGSHIEELHLSGADGNVGGYRGSDGGYNYGGAGSNGFDGSPPGNGSAGDSAWADGSSGGGGAGGNPGYSIVITSDDTASISAIYARGGNGREGGDGGNAGTAIGGGGGSGGNSMSSTDAEDGGWGGDGGSASALGGNGGSGGNGGDGGNITVRTSVISTSMIFNAGGNGGPPGNGGSAGSASYGVGGAGGNGANGGAAGPAGNNGTAAADSGFTGSYGMPGANGGITLT